MAIEKTHILYLLYFSLGISFGSLLHLYVWPNIEGVRSSSVEQESVTSAIKQDCRSQEPVAAHPSPVRHITKYVSRRVDILERGNSSFEAIIPLMKSFPRRQPYIGLGGASYCAERKHYYSNQIRNISTFRDEEEQRYITDHIRCMWAIAFTRFNDGEAALMFRKRKSAGDGWSIQDGQRTSMGEQLKHSLMDVSRYPGKFVVGLPHTHTKSNLRKFLQCATGTMWRWMNVTDFTHASCAIVFGTEGGFAPFQKFLKRELTESQPDRSCIIGMFDRRVKRVPAWATWIFVFPSNSIKAFESGIIRQLIQSRVSTIARHLQGPCTVLFSVGPLSEVLIAQMAAVNPELTYIDIGSSITPFITQLTDGNNLPSRKYMQNQKERKGRSCHKLDPSVLRSLSELHSTGMCA